MLSDSLRFLVAGLLLIAGSAVNAAGCDEKCLRGFTDQYLAALLKHDPSAAPLAPNVKFTENGKLLKPGQGLWQKAASIGTYRQYFEDPQTSNAVFIGVVDEGGALALLSLRLGISGQKISAVEAIVARKGSHPLFAPEAFKSPDRMFTTPVAANDRKSRSELIAITDSYFDGVEKHDSKVVQSVPACRRIENGVQTTQRNGNLKSNCASAADVLLYIKSVIDRRFLTVDPQHGVVVVNFMFDIPGGDATDTTATSTAPLPNDPDDPRVRAALQKPRMLLLTELFKIENGKIQHIEAIMHNLPHGAKSGWEQ